LWLCAVLYPLGFMINSFRNNFCCPFPIPIASGGIRQSRADQKREGDYTTASAIPSHWSIAVKGAPWCRVQRSGPWILQRFTARLDEELGCCGHANTAEVYVDWPGVWRPSACTIGLK